MVQITMASIKDIESITSKALVGEICKLIEEIEKQNLSKEASLSLIKTLLKNKVYENSRNHTNLLLKFSEGLTAFSVNFIKPEEK